MQSVIHFQMIVEMNELLKLNHIDYQIHSIGGCASCGVMLECIGKEQPLEDVIKVMNAYLEDHFLVVVQNQYDSHVLNVISKFDRFKNN